MRFSLSQLLLIIAALPLAVGGVQVFKLWTTRCIISSVIWIDDSNEVIASTYRYRYGHQLFSNDPELLLGQDIVRIDVVNRSVDTIFSIPHPETRIHYTELYLTMGKSLAYLKSKGILAVSSWTQGIFLFDTTNNSPIGTTSLKQGDWNSAVAVSEVGNWLITRSPLYSLDAMSYQESELPWRDIDGLVAVTADGTRLATVISNGIEEHELDTNPAAIRIRTVTYVEPNPSLFYSLEYSTDGEFLVAGSSRGVPTGLCVWKRGGERDIPEIVDAGYPVWDISRDPTMNRRVAVVGKELGIAVVDLDDKSFSQLVGANEKLVSCCYSPAGNYLATGNSKGDVTIWDAATWEKIATYNFASSNMLPTILWSSCLILWYAAWRYVRKRNTNQSDIPQ